METQMAIQWSKYFIAVFFLAHAMVGGFASAQYYGQGATNTYGGSANQQRIQQMQSEASRQQRNTERLEEIRQNNQWRRQQEANGEIARRTYQYQAPSGYWGYPR